MQRRNSNVRDSRPAANTVRYVVANCALRPFTLSEGHRRMCESVMIRLMFDSLGRIMWNLFGGRKPLPASLALMVGATEDLLAPEIDAHEHRLRRAMKAASEPEPVAEEASAAVEDLAAPQAFSEAAVDAPVFEVAPELSAPMTGIVEFEAVAVVCETPDDALELLDSAAESSEAIADEPVPPPEDDMPAVETVAQVVGETAAPVTGDDGEQDGVSVRQAKPRKSAEKKSAGKKAPKKRAARKPKAADADAPSTDDVGDEDAAGENFVPFEAGIEGPAP